MTDSAQHLAQFNIARLRYALDDLRLIDFISNLDRVNALAERMPGFVWRLMDASGNATNIKVSDDPRIIVNMSVWESVEALEHYVWQTVHKQIYARRHEWFEHMEGPYLVMWWVPAGHRPGIPEGLGRLDHLRRHGPADFAFTWDSVPPLNCGKRHGAREMPTGKHVA